MSEQKGDSGGSVNPIGGGAVPPPTTPAAAVLRRWDHERSEHVMTVRLLAAIAVLVSAAVHLYLWMDGMKDVDVIGPAFMLNAIGGAVIAVLLLVWRHWIPAFLTLGFGVSTLGAFITSATVGLFGVQEQWQGWPVWTAAISEVVAILTGAWLLLQDNPLRSRSMAQHDPAAGGAHLH